MAWTSPLPATVAGGETTHITIHNQIRAVLDEIRTKTPDTAAALNVIGLPRAIILTEGAAIPTSVTSSTVPVVIFRVPV